MKKILSGVTLCALMAPIMVSAATAEELTAQIQALLLQVTALQQQVGGSPSVPATPGVPGTTGGTSSAVQCPLISRNLKKGMTGADVTRLQQFLALDPSIYPEAQVTGYYGALTEAAVKRFQCKNTLVCDGTPESTGYGVTGPRTAALLALQCAASVGSGSNVGGFIKVTPTAGNAPLAVSIEATVNTTKSCTGATYEIIYGDNTPSGTITVPANSCGELRQLFTHTYTGGGTYTIVLRSGVHQTTATVTVSGGSSAAPSSSTFTRSPASGASPLPVVFSGTLNAGGACYTGQYSIQFGDGQNAVVQVPTCSPSSYTINHTYETSGNFIAGFYRGSEQIASLPVSVGGTSGSQGGGAFSITAGTSGDPFTVTAQFALSSSCGRYDLDWGDGTVKSVQSEGTCSAGAITKELNHTYQSGGVYTVTLKRGSNLSSTDTVGVTIVQ